MQYYLHKGPWDHRFPSPLVRPRKAEPLPARLRPRSFLRRLISFTIASLAFLIAFQRPTLAPARAPNCSPAGITLPQGARPSEANRSDKEPDLVHGG